jgi:glycerol-3-phosphate cytidylyltransferase
MKKVITYGSFDLFHEGHYNLLKNAKALGDYLIVGVTTEQYDLTRGKLNVVDPLLIRVDNVRKTGFANEVIIEDHEGQKLKDIQKYGVDIFTVGSDWVGRFDYLKEYCGVVYLERTKNISSTLLRRERQGIVRLGIVGGGRISGRLMEEVRFVSGVQVTACFNPKKESAETFSKRWDLALPFDNFDALLKSVDAVYIASPHGTHFEYCGRAIAAGKHVLCEKPMVLSEAEARELYSAAIKQGVVLLEANKTAFSPGFLQLLAIAKSGKIGRIHDVEAAFTKLTPYTETAREYDGNVGGSFTELASYPLLPIIKLLGRGYNDLRFKSIIGENGVDIYTKAQFTYDNACASAKTGIGVKSEGQLLISGTNGYILVKSPWWLTKSFQVCYENTEENEMFSSPFLGFGLRYELADFIRAIFKQEPEIFQFSAGDSIAMAAVMEEFLKQR